MKLLLASHNKKKMEEMRRMLEPMGIEVIAPGDVNATADAEETGASFAENARIKALDLFYKTGIPTIADDSGLCVNILGGRPGVHSARYGGEDLPHEDKINLLLRELEGVPMKHRDAYFACSVCCVLAEGVMIEAEGICEGVIGFFPLGDGGFGYDPIFMVGNDSFATLRPEKKDAVSHRSAALRQFREKLEALIAERENTNE
jgi:XTP/dITP diphosphohydrolase